MKGVSYGEGDEVEGDVEIRGYYIVSLSALQPSASLGCR
jgi:hypothetical protein